MSTSGYREGREMKHVVSRHNTIESSVPESKKNTYFFVVGLIVSRSRKKEGWLFAERQSKSTRRLLHIKKFIVIHTMIPVERDQCSSPPKVTPGKVPFSICSFQFSTHSTGQMDLYILNLSWHASSPFRCWHTRNSLKRVLWIEYREGEKEGIGQASECNAQGIK